MLGASGALNFPASNALVVAEINEPTIPNISFY